jgi:phosphatidylglycerol:prolipoprotein diacylglycerol transferase
MGLVLAGISYTTFPEITLGPLTLRTFGLMVGIGVVVGAWLAARVIEDRTGTPREETYSLATKMVVAGIVGSRITWVLSHLDEIDNPIDIIAVWEGGLQFSGGFIAAIIFGFPSFRKWTRQVRWQSLDGYAYGLTAGLAIGRIGCYSVGEHFGSTTSFFLGTTYQGGSTREGLAGTAFETASQLQLSGVGTTFHQTALYEFLYLGVLFAVFSYLIYGRSKPTRPGTIMASFCFYYGVMRFVSDSLRVNDETVLGMTGAQYMCLALIPTSLWIWFKVRPTLELDGPVPDDGADAGPAHDDGPPDEGDVDDNVDDDVDAVESDDDADYPSIDRS